MPAYYNEFDPKAAAWLRELIKRGLIADGEVDERDLWDVTPYDIRAFTQVHLCAGIGVWSYALRQAGWPDDRPVWTASFPCQPFSAAGKGKGFADERHLWPAGHFLIEECRPPVVFGEQVASKDGLNWFDLVQTDLEAAGYACGAVDLCAAGLGAPHIRQRLYWTAERLADACGEGLSQQCSVGRVSRQAPIGGARGAVERDSASDVGLAEPSGRSATGGRGDGGVGDTGRERDEPRGVAGNVEHPAGQEQGEARQREWSGDAHSDAVAVGGLADAAEPGREPRGRDRGPSDGRGASRVELRRLCDAERMADAIVTERPDGQPRERNADATRGRNEGAAAASGLRGDSRPGPTNGLWRDADWLFCRDGKFRPVEPGTFPLVDGAAARVGRLRGYGNAIVAPVAQAFIEAYLDARRAAEGEEDAFTA